MYEATILSEDEWAKLLESNRYICGRCGARVKLIPVVEEPGF